MKKKKRVHVLHLAERIVIPQGRQFIFCSYQEVQWIEARGVHCHFHCTDARYVVRQRIGDIQNLLPDTLFKRVHRSAVVNLLWIRQIKNDTNSKRYFVLLADGSTVPCNREFAEQPGGWNVASFEK